MKHRILSLLLALTAAVSLFAGDLAYPVEAAAEASVRGIYEPVFSEDMPMANPTGKKPAAPATVANINNETFLKYTSIRDVYKPTNPSKHIYLYNFNTSMAVGYGEDGKYIYTEAYYGAKSSVNDRKVTITLYNHTDTKLAVTEATLEHMDASDTSTSKMSFANNKVTVENSKGDISFANNKLTIDTSNYKNGAHRVWFQYSNGKYIKINFYVNGNDTWLCQTEHISDKTAKAYAARRSDLAKVLKNGNVTPSNSTSLENVWYPCYAFNSDYRCDTQKWIDLSNEIVNKNWSNEYKLFVIQDWIRNNLAYDEYQKESGIYRTKLHNDYTGTYSTYDTKTGVCFDYANIMCIMCRAQNIPAVTIGSKELNHVWNAVYINNRWIEYDACAQEKYWTKNEDITVKTKSDSYNDPYAGIYKIILWWWDDEMPSDALANQYFQQNSYYVYS